MLSDSLCSYCLRARTETGRLVASPLAAICRQCAQSALDLFTAAPAEEDVEGPSVPWRTLDDEALLARLPHVASAGDQVEAHLGTWVQAARDRNISWGRIGTALGMTRQSAWERFSAH